MKVCLICEGGYPYVTGGVSSWVQMIIETFSDIDFVIWSIATNREEMGEIRYSLPPNIKEIKTIYLHDIKFKSTKTKVKLSKSEFAALRSLMVDGNEILWTDVLNMIKGHRKKLVDLLLGTDFFNIAIELYNTKFTRTIFVNFLWNLRSMYFPLMSTLTSDVPEADIYHSVSTGYAGLLGSVASHIFNKPLIITEHGIYSREREEELIKSDWVIGDFKKIWINFFRKISTIAYQKAVRVITLFESNRQLQLELGCPEEKTGIIPNGVDVSLYESLISKYRISRATINIGVVARVVPIKDIKTMLYVFDVAKLKVPNLALYILGPKDEDKEYSMECLDIVQELNITDVYFTGKADVKEYLPDFDFMLLTSISEGQPLAVLEGMAAYLPQICTNVGSCSELLNGSGDDTLGIAGIITPVMDVSRIAQAIITLATDKSLRESMAQIGHERVKRYYQKQDFLDHYYSIYRDIHNKYNH